MHVLTDDEVFKPLHLPAIDKSQKRTHKLNPIRQSPYKRPTLAPRTKLETINEEPVLEEIEPQDISATLSFNDLSLDHSEHGDKDTSSEDSDFDGWDDETTLVSRLQEK